MVDFYSHKTLSKIQSGKRVQPVLELFDMQVESGTLTSTIPEAIKPTLLIGEKRTSYKGYASSLEYGQLAGSISVTKEPVYPMLPAGIIGSKYRHSGELVHFAKLERGPLANKVYRGISTHGIGYVPPETDTSDKEVRRWPRNWYGDNIKS